MNLHRINQTAATLLLVTGMVAPAFAQPVPQKRALLVGVSSYKRPGLANKPLPFAAPDMELLAKRLQSSGWSVTLLVSNGERDQATRRAIDQSLTDVLDGARSNGLVLVALSGHGLQFRAPIDGTEQEEAFFCPSDAVADDPSTLLGVTELTRRLGKAGSRNLVLIDACRDDPRRGAKGVDGNSARNVPPNTAVLFSCAARQQSFETNQMYEKGSDKGHGIFFYRVWKGLQGDARDRNGAVTWNSLVGYVTETVNEDALRWFPERSLMIAGERVVQTPHLVSSLVGRSPELVPATGSNRAMGSSELYQRGSRQLLEARTVAQRREAVQLLLEAADRGSAAAAGWLTVVYESGLGVTVPDPARAMKWLRRSAEGGYAAAQADLGGRLLSGGAGLEQDTVEAARWLARAMAPIKRLAESGDALAQNNYGFRLMYGQGIDRDEVEAIRWFRKSANQRLAWAFNNLGFAYLRGTGVAANREEAIRMFRQGAECGCEGSKEVLSSLGVQP